MTTALYRRYRPEAFAEVVGQEHVTEPLMQALRADRVNHAYLFSGPRGCGKTTSARILARCLNCEQGPTDTPCGVCPSCVELARGGSGSVDVVEIDAASHNGVDDARELRERAAFAPARDRYKIFILDEAHMVTPQGFNALLKLVEEPPPHVRFVFATTEPDKVISTIRSRTHHYPFRLVPPGVLGAYLERLCESEGVSVEAGVLPLVVRAGGGSVRDSLSVLDQLIAGSGPEGVTYAGAIALLGYTDATLLDDAVDGIAAGDGASLFGVVARVIQTGHEPRRFVEDLLERLRDIVVLAAAGPSGIAALGEVPEDQLARLRDQARKLGLERASRAGDLVNDALTSMVGATSPRLHLELMCARLLAADGAPTRVDAAPPAAKSAAAPEPAAAATLTSRRSRREEEDSEPAAVAAPAPEPAPAPAPEFEPASAPEDDAESEAEPEPESPGAEATPPEREASAPPPPPPPPAPEPAAAGATPLAGDAELIRRRWAEVLGTLERRRVTWVLVSQSAQVAAVDGDELRLAFSSPQLAERFAGGQHAENVALAIRETLGIAVRVLGVHGEQAPSAAPAPPAPAGPAAVPPPPPTPASAATPPAPASAARPVIEDPPPPRGASEDEASADDAPAPDAELSGAEAVARLLGGTVVDDGSGT